MKWLIWTLSFACLAGPLENARNKQDLAALERMAKDKGAVAAAKTGDAAAQQEAALAYSYAAEVAQELRDKAKAKSLAEAGIPFGERAVALKGDGAEAHRLLGTLCGQVIPANVLAGLKYGKRAQQELDRAVELEPRNAKVLLSRGVGYYYLPAAFGGGFDKALELFQKAAGLDPKSDEAFLWAGLALRKLNRNPEARAAFSKSLQLNPARVWTKSQLEKTPPN
ncbi:MAG: hypothetical protein ACKV22_04065 [Bryobacteraceae bacterium]